MAGQHLFVITSRLTGIVVAVELDVAEQQRYKSAPAEHGGLGVRILRLSLIHI